MGKVLDLNTATLPTLELTLQDEAKTCVHVTLPTEGLINELEALSPELQPIMTRGDKEGIEAIYDLAAKLISCNLEDKALTGKELREVYRMKLESAVVFYSVYLDFINEIIDAKN